MRISLFSHSSPRIPCPRFPSFQTREVNFRWLMALFVRLFVFLCFSVCALGSSKSPKLSLSSPSPPFRDLHKSSSVGRRLSRPLYFLISLTLFVFASTVKLRCFCCCHPITRFPCPLIRSHPSPLVVVGCSLCTSQRFNILRFHRSIHPVYSTIPPLAPFFFF